MKNMLKKALFTFVCAIAFLFAGGLSVKAAAGKLDNTTIAGYNYKYQVDGKNYYYVQGKKEDAKITLKAKNTNEGTVLGAANYRAYLSIVTCDGDLNINSGCSSWHHYNYNVDYANAYDLTEDLSKGVTLDFTKLAETRETKANNVSFASLESFYGINSTYFVMVNYVSQKLGAWLIKVEEKVYDTEIFMVVFEEDMPATTMDKEVVDGVTKITVKSATPITNVKYFHTSQDLSSGYDFETKYKSSGTGVEVLKSIEEDPKLGNGVFKYEFSFTAEEGENYHVQATNLTGEKYVKNLTKDDSTVVPAPNSPTSPSNPNKPESNALNQNVGKYILIALLIVLVLSLVLVIVQRIVDYKKKLY